VTFPVKISVRPTYSAVVSTVALVVALSTAGYAAVTLPENSVGSPQLKKGAVHVSDIGKDAVVGAKVRNGSLRVGDFRAGDLPTGPRRYVTMLGNGSIAEGSALGVTAANVDADSEEGLYCFSFPGETVKSAMVAPAVNGLGPSDVIASVIVDNSVAEFGTCAGQVVVTTEDAVGRKDWGFTLWLQ
jgi:hypothetical protein